MYEGFFSENRIIMDPKLPHSLRPVFPKWEGLFDGDKSPKYIAWVKVFIEDHPDRPQERTLLFLEVEGHISGQYFRCGFPIQS